MPSTPSTELAVFPNPAPARDYLIHIECPEFTCLCPLTGQPDFATLVLDYIPEKLNLELKGLKLYLWSFRDRGVFHEAVTNEIVDQMAARIKPRFLRLTAKWYVRGGLFTTVIVEHRKRGWKPAPGTLLGAAGAEGNNASVRG
jgi:7-cyano-7-deazaguanine reductase